MITANIHRVRQTITDACNRVNRNPADVTLIAVSKTHSSDAVLKAIEAGVQHFGENRVEEAHDKIQIVNAHAATPVTWHMIGHIQSRKAKDVFDLFDYVHSVDSLKLAGKLSGLAVEAGNSLNILLEMNVSGEQAKYGFSASGWDTDRMVRDRLWEEVAQIVAMRGLTVQGLMTMAPMMPNPEQTRPIFASLALLRRALSDLFQVSFRELSMGMTDDYPIAVEEGATMVRVGRAIFGERDK